MTERGAALGVGVLAAIVTALPAVPRVVEKGASAPFGLLALVGGTALVLGPLIVFAGAVRAEKTGVRATLFGLCLAAAPLAAVAEGLKQGTHHRPLGAATFAVLALATVVGAMAVAWRLLAFSGSGNSGAKRIVFLMLVAAALGSIAVVLVRAFGSPAYVPHVLDALRALATATLGHLLLRFPRVTTVARRAGAPLWVAAVVSGLVLTHVVHGGTTLLGAVRSAAPVLGGPAAWF